MDEERGEGTRGPSWWDVEELHKRVETQYNCQVLYLATCTRTRKEGRYGWWVQAAAHEPKALSRPARAVGAAAFRGNSGARTYTAALWLALLNLLDALDDKRIAAEQQQLF